MNTTTARKRSRATAASKAARVVPEPLHEVRESTIQGRGVFARVPLAKGARIIEYTGEPVSHAEADRRYDDAAMARHHTFLFTLDSRTVVDGFIDGNDSRFINHSCEPNCEAVIEQRQIWIWALRDIAAGEELAYDYGYERDGSETAEDEARYTCICGAATCRGSILVPVASPAARAQHAKARHTDHVAS